MDSISIIFSTYNSEKWLEKVLWGFGFQSFKNFEIVIADDGSTNSTRELIESLGTELGLQIKHVWQKDEGFQKSKILNKALTQAEGDYIIFTDGDCIPKSDFVKIHSDRARQGHFLSGGYFKLPMSISNQIAKDDIASGLAFEPKWLLDNGLPSTYKLLKMGSKGVLEWALNTLTPAGATWNGHNSSGWKKDILAVNGFDERMQYGGQDRELGERMINNGIKPIQIRYSAICLHLDHSRGYKTEASIQRNKAIRAKTKYEKRTWTNYGIKK